MIESLEDILGAGPDDTLGEIDGTTYGAVSLVVAHGWDGSRVWGFLSEWLSSRECAIITKNQVIEDQARQIARLTEERDKARRALEVATQIGTQAKQGQAIIALANGATLTPEQEQDLRRAVADLKQTNSHAVPLAPLLTRICRCEDCEAHRKVLAEGGTITTSVQPKVDPNKVCQCDECRELRKYLSDRNAEGWQVAECEEH